MINLDTVNWYNDGVTRRYLREHADELLEPEKMTPNELASAICYIDGVKNPYADELVKRASSDKNKVKYHNAPDAKTAMEAVVAVAKEFGIKII